MLSSAKNQTNEQFVLYVASPTEFRLYTCRVHHCSCPCQACFRYLATGKFSARSTTKHSPENSARNDGWRKAAVYRVPCSLSRYVTTRNDDQMASSANKLYVNGMEYGCLRTVEHLYPVSFPAAGSHEFSLTFSICRDCCRYAPVWGNLATHVDVESAGNSEWRPSAQTMGVPLAVVEGWLVAKRSHAHAFWRAHKHLQQRAGS